MTSSDSKVLLGSQKMRTHVTMVFAWSEPTDIFPYCALTETFYNSVQKKIFAQNMNHLRRHWKNYNIFGKYGSVVTMNYAINSEPVFEKNVSEH